MALSIDDYQEGTRKTAIYTDSVVGAFSAFYDDSAPRGFLLNWANVSYCAHGLSGESGEVAGQVKKALRDDGGFFSEERKQALFKELGDVAWYLSQMCTELGFKLQDVMDYNLTKLASRQDRGVLGGSGDNR